MLIVMKAGIGKKRKNPGSIPRLSKIGEGTLPSVNRFGEAVVAFPFLSLNDHGVRRFGTSVPFDGRWYLQVPEDIDLFLSCITILLYTERKKARPLA